MSSIRLAVPALLLLPSLAIADDFERGVEVNKKDYDKAIARSLRPIRLAASFFAAYYNRGYAHAEKKEHDQAIKDFSEAITPRFEVKPDLDIAHGEALTKKEGLRQGHC